MKVEFIMQVSHLIRKLFYPVYFFKKLNFDKKAYNHRIKDISSQVIFNKKISVLDYKKSDKLFVLGSGSSISHYSSIEWQTISNHDSIGFNYWLIHRFVPTYYVFEVPYGGSDKFFEILSMRAKEYSNVPLIMKDAITMHKKISHLLIPKTLLNNFFILEDYSIPGSNLFEFKKSLNYLKLFGFFKTKNVVHKIFKKRASLSYIIHFAIMFGYKDIILCGVDLNDTSYFWEINKDYYQSIGIPLPETNQYGNTHRTLNKEFGDLTIDEVLYAINDVILKPRGIKLSVAKKTSALFPELGAFFD